MKKFIIVAIVLFGVFSHADAASLKASTLRVGSTGETVRTVQQKLSEMGYSVSVDGKFGRKTSQAVAKFQASQNLKADGLAGEKTLALILNMRPLTGSTAGNGGIVPINPPTIPRGPITGDVVWDRTCADGNMHIQLFSPNGNEVYLSSQQIPVTWRTCNVASDKLVHLSIRTYQNGNPVNIGSLYSAQTGTPNVPNTGSALSRVFSDIGGIQYNPGKNYKVIVGLTDSTGAALYPYANDESDNLFTINDPVQQVDVCNNITGVQTTVPAGMRVADGNCYQIVDPWTATCSDTKPHVQVISPNGGEIYATGQQIDIKWKTCNIPSEIKALVILGDRTHSIGGDLATDTANDGYESVTIPTWPNMYYGNFYDVRVSFPPFGNYTGIMLSDNSDNTFTINQGGIFNPKTSTQISAQ